MNYSRFICLGLLLSAATCAVVVNQIQGLSDINLVYTGTIPISATNNLFFTYYGIDNVKDQSALKNSPLLICVGSPGSSAQYLSLSSVGPLKLNSDLTLSLNPNRLTAYSNTMFIDLLGSGFSFAASPSDIPNEAHVFGAQLTTAINTFIKESVLGQSKTIIIAGEGTFIRSLPGVDEIGIDTLQGIIHISSWPQMYAIGKYYGAAGVELKIFSDSERIAIESTFTSCYNYIRSSKFLEAHTCFESILNFVESKTKNCNLFDVRLGSNFTQSFPMIQYYFSQPEVVTKMKAPNSRLFEAHSGYISNKTFVDFSKNYTKNISQFMKDYLTVKHWFVSGDSDFIAYRKAFRLWVENQLAFVESDTFRSRKLEDLLIDDVVVGATKAVKQVTYTELLSAGHYVFNDQPKIMSVLFKRWLDTLTGPPNSLEVESEIREMEE